MKTKTTITVEPYTLNELLEQLRKMWGQDLAWLGAKVELSCLLSIVNKLQDAHFAEEHDLNLHELVSEAVFIATHKEVFTSIIELL